MTHLLLHKIRAVLILMVLTMGMAACSDGSKYRIVGDTADGREMTLRLVIYTPEGVENYELATRSGHFEFENNLGETDFPAYIEIYSHDYRLLGLAEAPKGAELEMTIDQKGISGYKVTDRNNNGPDSFSTVLTQWLGKVKDIDNNAISGFVKAHPDNAVALAVLSTMYDASDPDADTRSLILSLKPEALPPYYDNGFITLADLSREIPTELEPATLLCNADTLFEFNPDNYEAVLIAFDLDDNDRRDSVVPMLQKLGATAGKKRLVMEQSLVPDTNTWRRALRSDLRNFTRHNEKKDAEKLKDDKIYWTSVWTGVGPAAPFANRFSITSLPYFVVADSTANRYSGPSADKARRTYEKLYKK